MAKARGITTRTYIDTVNTDWHDDVAISVLMLRHSLNYQISFISIPGFYCALTSQPPQNIKVFRQPASYSEVSNRL